MIRFTRSLFVAASLALLADGAAHAQSQYFWSNYAGQAGTACSLDGTGSAAGFSAPNATAVDGSGNVYVADTANNTIRKITPAGVVTTLAGTPGIVGSSDGTGSAASFNTPTGIAVTADGSSIFVADSHNFTIRKVTSGGVVTTIAGTAGVSGYVDGTGSGAAFASPVAVATDGSNIYVADAANNAIREVTAGGVVTTFAGGGPAGMADGTGTAAQFNNPSGVATNGGSLIYVADTCNHSIRQITSAGVVTTLAGVPTLFGTSSGVGSAAQFYYPSGLAVDSGGNVYVADSFNNSIRVVTPSGSVSTLAGLVQSGGNIDFQGSTNGVGTLATFNDPTGLSVDGSGNVYIADSGNNAIRKATYGVVSNFAGGMHWGITSATVPNALFNSPTGITADTSGNVYVADTNNFLIRKITPQGVVSQLEGATNSSGYGTIGSSDGTGTSAHVGYAGAMAADGVGNLYVADTSNNTVRKIVVSSGAMTTLAGTAGVVGSTDGTTTAAQFDNPAGIAANSAGTFIYVADTYNHTIRQVTSAGVVTTIAGTANTAGSTDGAGSAALFDYPSGVVVDSSGNVYVADSGNCTIRKLTNSSGTWTSTTIAGTAGTAGNIDGTGSAALFNNPTCLSIDGSNNLYVVDTGNHTVRMVTPGGVVTTIGGTGAAGMSNGIGTASQFSSPNGIVVTPTSIFVVDTGNNRVSIGTLETTSAATSIAATTATLNGQANANGIANGVEFQYWLSTTPTTILTTSIQPISGTSFAPVSASVTGLTANATYYYRIVLTVNGTATYYGSVQQLVTLPSAVSSVTNTSLAAATVGIPYSAQITANNSPTSWGASPLPPGLSVNPLTGAITGTPTTTGTTSVTLSATNAVGTGTKALSLTVNALALPTFSGLTLSTVQGSPVNYTITAANFPTSYGASNLPPGLVVNPSTGLIDGNPQTPGNYQATLSATNLTGTATATLSITVLPTYVWSTLAGVPDSAGSTDGQVIQVGLLYMPYADATDSNGNVYVADTYNDTVRKITPAGVMTTLAGSAGHAGSTDGTGSAARFNYPEGIAVDGSGNVYVADTFNDTIRKITPAGVVTTFAGSPGLSGSTNGTGSAARFGDVQGITVDPSTGNIYVTDTDTIRAITPAGVVTTLAGTYQTTGSTNGTGAAARFENPEGIVADGQGNLYVVDGGNSTIRKIVISTAAVTTFAGTAGTTGFVNATGSAAEFEFPSGITMDSNGNLYVADVDNEAIREITTPGAVVTTYAGGQFGTANGTGTAAQFEFPEGVAADSNGNVYVAEYSADTIRKIAPGAVVTTFAGIANVSGSTDGSEGTPPRFSTPAGVAVDTHDNVYVADTGNDTIREITATGAVTTVTTIAGTAGTSGTTDGTGSAALFYGPTDLAFDSNGNLFVVDSYNDTIRKLTYSAGTGWTSTTFAGMAGTTGLTNGTGTAALFNTPTGLAIDSSNNIYVADSGNQIIRKITPLAAVTTYAGTVTVSSSGVSTGVAGSTNTTTGPATNAKFNAPTGVAVDSSGNVYVADQGNNLIREITPAGVVSTVAGSSAAIVDGVGTAAEFNQPYGIAVDGGGNLYVADMDNEAIRKIVPDGANWMVTTIAGNGFGTTPTGGTVGYSLPAGIAVDAQGNVLVANEYGEDITIGAPILPPSISSTLTASGQQGTAFTYVITASNMPTPFSSYNATPLPAGLSVNTITGAITGTPTVSGSFSPTISATNLAGTANATLALSIASSLTPYQQWQQSQFNAAQLTNPAISGDNADPANDGVPNLLKYALGLNAFQSYNPASTSLPYVRVNSSNYLTLTFTGTATDVTYNVQATSNLSGTWTTIQSFPSGGTAPGTVTVQDTQPTSAASSRYMRLQVTRP